MRHTSHIMLGADAASMLEHIKQYVLKYGSEELGDYFKAFLFPELDPSKEACFQTAQLETDAKKRLDEMRHAQERENKRSEERR